MRTKQFTKKQVKSKIKEILKIWKSNNLEGGIFPLTEVIGNYQYNSMNRHIKEALFFNIYSVPKIGGKWYLRYPKKNAKQMAKKVMKYNRNS